MASRPDPHFVVESLVESVSGSPLVIARRLDNHDFLVLDGSLLNGMPIAAADMPRALNAVGEGRTDLWAFFLKSAGDLGSFAVGQTVVLQESGTRKEHE